MKAELTIFRILTFILLPISAFFGCMGLMLFFIALSNPTQLFPLFLIAAFVVYIFSSLRFLTRHIDRNQPAKASLRDWIRVNGFATILMAVMSLISAAILLTAGDDKIRETVTTALETQSTPSPMINEEAMIGVFKSAVWFMLVLSSLLLVHIVLCFRTLKRYRYLFTSPQAD